MKLLPNIIPFIFLISSSNGQRLASGSCPTVQPKADFEKHLFLGNWVETEKSPSFFDLIMRCTEVNYSDSDDGSINVKLKGTSYTNMPVNLNGDGVISEADTQGRYTVRYSIGIPIQGTQLTVIDTDYKKYAVVYTCTNSIIRNLFHSEHVSIYTKDAQLDNPTRQNIYELLDRMNINRAGLTEIDRKPCPKQDIEHKNNDALGENIVAEAEVDSSKRENDNKLAEETADEKNADVANEEASVNKPSSSTTTTTTTTTTVASATKKVGNQ